MPYLLNAVVLGKSPIYFSRSRCLKLLLSLIRRPITCSARIAVDTHSQTKYHSPRYTYAPGVNKLFKEIGMAVPKSMQIRVGMIQVWRWSLLFPPKLLKFHTKVKQKQVRITFVLESSLALFACFLVLPSLLPWTISCLRAFFFFFFLYRSYLEYEVWYWGNSQPTNHNVVDRA